MNFNYKFSVSLRFEIFLALQVLTDSTSKIHVNWKKDTLKKLPESFNKNITRYGFNSAIWVFISDVLENKALEGNFEQVISNFQSIQNGDMQRKILEGAIHYQDIVEEILNDQLSLEKAINKIPKTKQEWLAFIGLYPFNRNQPIALALELLLSSPNKFKLITTELLTDFWENAYKETWSELLPKFELSIEEKSRLYISSDLNEFAKHALIPIEVDEKGKSIKALRGGYQLPFNKIDTLIFIPSAFNYKRLWTDFENNNGKINAYFPFFEPSISLNREKTFFFEQNEYELEPALIFKALGDTTRYAIVSIIAKEPISSMELSKRLSLTKATVSHHVHILREAGLLKEKYENGSVILSLKREIIEMLSRITIEKLYK